MKHSCTTLTSRNNKVDFTGDTKADFIFGEVSNTFFGGLFGAGFSSDLDKWALRPEIGISFADDMQTFMNYGLGLQIVLPTRKKIKQ